MIRYIVQELKNFCTKCFVFFIIFSSDKVFFGKMPEALNQIQVWSICRKKPEFDSGVIFKPFADFSGHDELQIIPGRMQDMFAQTMHVMTNHLVDVDGERATGTVMCTARHLTLDRENSMNVMIRYIDNYERRDEAWKIADRQIRFLWSEQHAAIDIGFGQ